MNKIYLNQIYAAKLYHLQMYSCYWRRLYVLVLKRVYCYLALRDSSSLNSCTVCSAAQCWCDVFFTLTPLCRSPLYPSSWLHQLIVLHQSKTQPTAQWNNLSAQRKNKWRWLLGAVWIYLLLFFLIVRHLHSLTYLHFHTLSTFLLNVILLGFRCMFFCILPKLWCCKKKTKFTRQSFVPFYFSFKMRRNCSCCDCLFLLRSSQKSISNHMGVKP